MKVIEAPDIDLISPFPLGELPRLKGWLHCYQTLTHFGGSAEQVEGALREFLPQATSFGVIDKNHLTNSHHEAPLVGMLLFERASPTNAYLHLACGRKAWGGKFIDQGEMVACRRCGGSGL